MGSTLLHYLPHAGQFACDTGGALVMFRWLLDAAGDIIFLPSVRPMLAKGSVWNSSVGQTSAALLQGLFLECHTHGDWSGHGWLSEIKGQSNVASKWLQKVETVHGDEAAESPRSRRRRASLNNNLVSF